MLDDRLLVLKVGFPNQEIVKQIYIIEVCVERFRLQEKADTRIILHDYEANRQFKDKNQKDIIIVNSLDTHILADSSFIHSLGYGRQFVPEQEIFQSFVCTCCSSV